MALRRIDHDFFGPIMGQVFGLDEQMSPAMRHMAIDIVEVRKGLGVSDPQSPKGLTLNGGRTLSFISWS